MQNLLLTAKGVLKIADFGMAREYSSRPLTPGVVTIWYRAPELLLGTKRYNSSIDMWSTGLILAEFLLSQPCLTGESPLDQLSGTVKLIGSPSTDDLNALSNMGCPQLVRWQREGGIGAGRADNLSSRFAAASTEGTVDFLRGLLTWDPRARWTASEALSKTKTKYNTAAEKWWKESPRATEPALLPTFPEIRNGVTVGIGGEAVERDKGAQSDGPGKSAKEHGYVFDFGGESTVRPGKRRKGHI
ncbi:hypothetical protein MMC25_004659 [Agyrium rufum]|nr:hypothetical protein [Agyrium rufum]